MGILFYNYDMIKTVPRAFATVGATVVVSVLASLGLQRLKKPTSTLALGALTLGAFVLTINTYMKFSSGTYALTGSGFKTGAILMPVILALIFGEGLFKATKKA